MFQKQSYIYIQSPDTVKVHTMVDFFPIKSFTVSQYAILIRSFETQKQNRSKKSYIYIKSLKMAEVHTMVDFFSLKSLCSW